MKNYKGNVVEQGVEYVYALIFIGILLGAGAISLAAFASGQTGAAAATIGNASSGLTNLSVQLPTVGTLMGVGLILLVLFGALGYFMMKRQ